MNNDNFQMYQNSGYKNPRNRKRTLILDIDDSAASDTHLGSGGEFNIKLFEPLIIDKHSEVYLDNCLTYNCNTAATISQAAFCLKINEFNMNSNVASSSNNNIVFNSLIIPNDHKTVDNNHGAVVHKGKKFNYVCDINPQTIHSLSGKITDLSGASIFHGTNTSDKFTYALTGIDTYGTTTGFPIESGDTFTIDTTATGLLNVDNSQTGIFLATHFSTTGTLHFSTAVDLGNLTRTVAGDITFNITGGGSDSIVIDNSPVTNNPNLTLIQNPARFIAEFSIVSV